MVPEVVVAQEVQVGRSEAEVLAWLTVIAERRRRAAKRLCRTVRNPVGLFRWLCRHGRFPGRAYEDAKRRLSGNRQDAETRRRGDAGTGPPGEPQRIGDFLEAALQEVKP